MVLLAGLAAAVLLPSHARAEASADRREPAPVDDLEILEPRSR